MDERVGIDGNGLDQNDGGDLLQAALMESIVPSTGTVAHAYETYDPNRFYTCPWST
jgi:hypothetical protein